WVVFVSSIQCFNDTLNFIVTPDDWINFSVAGIVGYIGTKLIEQAIFFIAVLLACSCAALSLTTRSILLNWIGEHISASLELALIIYLIFYLFKATVTYMYLHFFIIHLHHHNYIGFIHTTFLTFHKLFPPYL